ncbi:MAG: hypothetical protein JRD93_04005 [Deltaproteobacteria bacterium]|nr:hypothetical protein [Deltaproteobacteria bacterium]
MTSAKILRPENTTPCLNNKEGKDVQFGPPPEEYSYRCSQCWYEMKVNEAIIDFEIGMAEFVGTYYEGFMPIVGCPNCNPRRALSPISTPSKRSLFVPSLNFGHKQHGPFNFFGDTTHLRPVTTHGLYCWLEMAGFQDQQIDEVGLEMNPYQFFRSIPSILKAFLKKDRSRLVTSLWNLIGWVSYGIGRKR